MQTQTKASMYTFSTVPLMLHLYSTDTKWLDSHLKPMGRVSHVDFKGIILFLPGFGLQWEGPRPLTRSLPVVALLAGVHVVHRLTAETANVAAPDELTLAALYVSYHVRVVAPPTAQQVTAVWPG